MCGRSGASSKKRPKKAVGPGGDFSMWSGFMACRLVQLEAIKDGSASSHLVFEQFPTISSIPRVRSIFSKGFGVVELRSVQKVFWLRLFCG